jgi:hypothetical protein
VYGNYFDYRGKKIVWNITTDLEAGQVEASSTYYYLYITETGQPVMSSTRPYARPDLKGRYHPHESWRMIGVAFNNSGSDIDQIATTMPKDDLGNTAVGGIASSTGGSQYTNNTASFTSVTGSSLSLVASGGPIYISLKSTATTTGLDEDEGSILASGSGTSGIGQVRLLRNGSAIAIYTVRGTIGGATSVNLYAPVTSVNYLDYGYPVGIVTYSLEGRGVGGSTIFINDYRLEAIELGNVNTRPDLPFRQPQ